MERPQSRATGSPLASAPNASVVARKILKWVLRIIGLFATMLLYLIWREASAKLGVEGPALAAFRGVIVFGTYLAFVEWTRGLDASTSEDGTDKSPPRITGEEFAKFVGISIAIVVGAYYSAPYHVSPTGLWWVAHFVIAAVAVWAWRKKKE